MRKQVNIRWKQKGIEKVEEAAKHKNKSFSEYVREAAEKQAEKDLKCKN